MNRFSFQTIFVAALTLSASILMAAEPWIVTGDVVIGVTFIANPPEHPPSSPTALIGSAALFGLEGGPQLERWRLKEVSRRGGQSTTIGEGDLNVENGELGEWSGADPRVDVLLRTVLTDSWGRTLVGRYWVLGDGPRTRRATSRRAP